MAMSEKILLSVQNIEVVYSQVILALRGVTLDVPEGSVVSLLGANGAGKTTTLKACSNLLHAERGVVTKGSIEYDDKDIAEMMPYDLVKGGVVQVLEGRHCFPRLTVEENLLTGSFIRKTASQSEIKADLEKVYEYFPRIRDRRKSLTGFTSGRRTTNDRNRSCAYGAPASNPFRRTFYGFSTAVCRRGV